MNMEKTLNLLQVNLMSSGTSAHVHSLICHLIICLLVNSLINCTLNYSFPVKTEPHTSLVRRVRTL